MEGGGGAGIPPVVSEAGRSGVRHGQGAIIHPIECMTSAPREPLVDAEDRNAYRQTVAAVEHHLATHSANGLPAAEAARRLAEFGPNVFQRRQADVLRSLFRRLTNALTLLLLAAVGISALLGETGDAVLISIVLVIDLTLGLVYESYTRYRIHLLTEQVPRVAEVRRDGVPRLIPVSDVVPGDLVVLRAGERVPADLRLTRVTGLRVDEAVLTGEPGDIGKMTSALDVPTALPDQRNMAFAGTTVTTGAGSGLAVATGPRSMLGMLARRVVEAGRQVTPLERHLRRLGQLIGAGVLLTAAFLFSLGVLRGEVPADMFRTVLTLAVAAIPEDLTFILTFALALGAVRLLRRGTAVRHLVAAETLGDATVVVTDKTGTLTSGTITLRRVEGMSAHWGASSFRAGLDDPLFRRALFGAIAGTEAGQSDAVVRGSALERALASALLAAGVRAADVRREYPLFATLAFDQRRRYHASLHDDPRSPEPILFVFGAPDTLLPNCTAVSTDGTHAAPLTADGRESLLARVASAAADGARVLALATRHLGRDQRSCTAEDVQRLTFLALLHFDDPLRPDAGTAVRGLRAAGVRTLLLTGDHVATGLAVARATGIAEAAGAHALDGHTLDRLADRPLAAALRETAVVGRVDPLQKERVVEVLQQHGDTVAMIGDGVNDAVALRRADLGVAVGSGTDVAKDASDLVLLDSGLAGLTAAVWEGRRIRETVRTVLAFLFSTNLPAVLAVAAALFAGLPIPFLPAQLLWVNVVSDGVADVALALEPARTRAGDQSPGRQRGLFRHRDLLAMALAALAVLIPTLIVFRGTLADTGDVALARTMAFVTLAAAQLLAAFSYRSLEKSALKLNPVGNVWLLAAEVVSFGLLVAAVHWTPLVQLLGTVPLTGSQWTTALVAAALGLIGVEARKWLTTLFVRTARRAHPPHWPVGEAARPVS